MNPIAKESRPYLLILSLFAGLSFFISSVLTIFWLFLMAGILFFFRDPERTEPEDPRAIVSPADGTVTLVDSGNSDPILHKPYRRVRIFLSIFDVHVNRAPLAGTVQSLRHVPGQFLNALKKEAFEHNESNWMVLTTDKTEIVVRQIAGLIARRIVCYVKTGQAVKRGERIGIIQFSSGLEIYLPLQAHLTVSPGQKVKAGSSVLGLLDKTT